MICNAKPIMLAFNEKGSPVSDSYSLRECELHLGLHLLLGVTLINFLVQREN